MEQKIKEIWVYDRNFRRLGIFESYEGLIWTRRFHKCGTFQIQAVYTRETNELLQDNRILWLRGEEEAGIIEYKSIVTDDVGVRKITISGRFLTSLLDRRIIWDRENISGNMEVGLRDLIDKALINPSNPKRKMDYITLPEPSGLDFELDMQVSYKNLLSTIEKVVEEKKVGIKTTFDPHVPAIYPTFYVGEDKTAREGNVNQIILSNSFENILRNAYLKDTAGLKNVCMVAGEGENEQRIKRIIGDAENWDRREVFVDARDLQSEIVNEDGDIDTLSEDEYLKKLDTRARQKMENMKAVENYQGNINPLANYRYKEDYDLGDRITVRDDELGVRMDVVIVEIEEVIERNGRRLEVSFGDTVPTIIDKLKEVVA